MSRALIIGSNSMLGRAVAAQLRALDHEVIRCARRGEAEVCYDLASLNPPPDAALGKLDAIFCCAASFADDSWDGCVANALVNAVAPYRIAQWAQQSGCPHVLLAGSVSSCAEFAPSSYGLSKAQGEAALQFACDRIGARFTAVRFPQLCDDDGLCARHQIWFARIVARAAAGADLRLPAGDQPRNFLHVADAARALVNARASGVHGPHVLTSPDSHTYREIAQMAYAAFGAGGRVVDAPEMRPFRPVTYPPPSESALALIAGERITMPAAIQRIKQRCAAARFTA